VTYFPPTLIVVHPRERRQKCTVEPLRGRPGFIFWTFPETGPQSLQCYVRLGLGGPDLSRDDAGRGLLVLDGTWRLAAGMEARFADIPIRSLQPWQTAYPRVSKLFDDPAAGLATIEAIFAAYHILGRDTSGLLDEYYWRDEFLRKNAERLTCGAADEVTLGPQ
jgi:pre-rRNA-processing protein TSR3